MKLHDWRYSNIERSQVCSYCDLKLYERDRAINPGAFNSACPGPNSIKDTNPVRILVTTTTLLHDVNELCNKLGM